MNRVGGEEGGKTRKFVRKIITFSVHESSFF